MKSGTQNIKALKPDDRRSINQDLSLSLENARFLSMRDAAFRIRLSKSPDENGTLLWVEDKQTKHQWQINIQGVDNYGPSGLPAEAILSALKVSLERIASNVEAKADRSSSEPMIDMDVIDGVVSIVLTLNVSGCWHPQYVFPLLPVALEKMDILEAQLRDAQEEIVSLKALLHEGAFLSRGASTVIPSTQVLAKKKGQPRSQSLVTDLVAWNGQSRRLCTESHFAFSPDFTTVTVLKQGIYLIQVRVGQTNRQQNGAILQPQYDESDVPIGRSFQLLVNDTAVAACLPSNNNMHGYQNYAVENTAQLFEIIHLKAQDVLSVKCQANFVLLTDELNNRFTIQLLQRS